jgi:tubulin polyglutamylase TTLL6/13
MPVSEESKKQPNKPNKKSKLIVNVSSTEYRVVKKAMKLFGYKLGREPEGEWDLFWADTGVTNEMLFKMKSYQKINHYPAMSSIARKNGLGKNLMRMRRLFPKEYSFFPSTWLLPFEWSEFCSQFNQKKCKTFIVKPEALSQGKGIFLTRTWKDLDPEEHYVVQRYIHKPYLIDGLKFDLRIYVLVYGCDPLRIFMFKEGLARLATDSYVPPNNSNLDDFFMHLTNYAINKNSNDFIFNSDPDKADVGHKRSLAFVWKHIDENGGNSTDIKQKIKEIVVKTLCSVQPELSNSYRTSQPADDYNDKCFEILGFDILIDSKFKPWLLEVNHSPSFSTDTPFDMKIKLQLITDTINILNMDPKKRIKYYKEKEIEVQNTKYSKHRIHSLTRLSKEERAECKRKHMEKRDEYELGHCGNYERIYPDKEDSNKYTEFIEAANKMWEEFYGIKKYAKKVKSDTNNKNTIKPLIIKKSEPLKPNSMGTPKSMKEETANSEGSTSRREAVSCRNGTEVLSRIYSTKRNKDYLPQITKVPIKGRA